MCLFARKRHMKAEKIEILPLEKIVEIMYNKNLSFAAEVTDVIYSHDKTKRYVVLMNDGGCYYTFLYEKIEVFDEDELRWMKTDSLHPDDVLPAYWVTSNATCSLFGTHDEALKNMRLEPEYKLYFE